jgi:hypothetical protein
MNERPGESSGITSTCSLNVQRRRSVIVALGPVLAGGAAHAFTATRI